MNKKQTVILLGLGRMGKQIAKRLHNNGFNVRTWNRSSDSPFVKEIQKAKIFYSNDLSEVLSGQEKNRIFWIMLPHETLDQFIFDKKNFASFLKKGDILIDGGNSYYKDSINRSKRLKKMGVYFFDSGTSGGIWGEKGGFALMVGGAKEKWKIIEPIFKALSSGDNYAFLGSAGAGHFTKMVHNGIEYGMMEAIAEGYAVLEKSPFKLNLKDVTRVYQKGSVVRSWLIDLCRNIFEYEDIKNTSGKIDSTGEGEWTIKTAKEFGVDVRVIEESFRVRQESKEKKNQNKFSNKIVSLLRKQFGGHKIHLK